MLSAAARSIRIIDHRVTDPQMLGLLAEKQRQGLSLQVLGNGPMDGLMSHGRMILIDGKTAIIGSIHLSPPSLDARREVAIVVEEPNLVSELYAYFESLARTEANIMNLWTAPSVSSQDEDDEEEE
jgi:phosphatidylserine/phosphatidylglycerophosphate/cardiolipin synthase-like enzyme